MHQRPTVPFLKEIPLEALGGATTLAGVVIAEGVNPVAMLLQAGGSMARVGVPRVLTFSPKKSKKEMPNPKKKSRS
jgi:hypothetical protein